MSVDFLAIGNITHDRTPHGIRLGGTVSYAAVTSWRMGRQSAILTRGSLDPVLKGQAATAAVQDGNKALAEALGSVHVHLLPSDTSTTFTNVYRNGERVQIIEAVAGPISPGELPPACADVPVVLLGPIARELPVTWAGAFPRALLGVSAQGWMRSWDEVGHVKPAPWDDGDVLLLRANVLFLSREDVGGDDARIEALSRRARLMVVTDGWRGARVYQGGSSFHVPPRPAVEVDPTGAGDVFATAFLIRLWETGDPMAAARFANVMASFSVEGFGMSAIPDREQVEAWLSSAT